MAGPDDSGLVKFFIPIFFVLIFVEYIYSVLKKSHSVFRFSDSMSSLTAGTMSEILGFVIDGALIVPYYFIHKHFNIVELPGDNWMMYPVLLLAVDLGYYWAHRCSHESNILWSGHVAHHSSELYNLTTALRQGALERVFFLPFWFFLPLFFSMKTYLFWRSCNTVFQFFVHTETIRKLPAPIEFIFNTPSHHRVHHARNPIYIDKNYAGMFVLWDRIFGTFEEESEPAVYGLVHPLQSWDPLHVQLHHITHVIKGTMQVPGLWNKLMFMWKNPGSYLDEQGNWKIYPLPEVEKNHVPYDARAPRDLYPYIILHYAITAVTLLSLEDARAEHGWGVALLMALFVYWSLHSLAMMCEGFERVKWIETARLLAVIGVVVWQCATGTLTTSDTVKYGVAGALTVASILKIQTTKFTRGKKAE